MGDTPPPVAIPSQGDLDQIRRRFLALNDKRLALALAELRPQQQDFPRLLPLLFHVNHPLLPGYVSEHCEDLIGIRDAADFTARTGSVLQASTHAPSFQR